MVYLTATLPPQDEPDFMKIMKIMKVYTKDIYTLRTSTSRPNIEYSVVEYDKGVESTSGVELANVE
jgi:hypothetical protein